MAKRKISRIGRKKLRQNALKGTHKWQRMSHTQRVRARRKKGYCSWGFTGHSPNTRPRKCKR